MPAPVPVLPDANQRNTLWYVDDIYVGPSGNSKQRWVPKVNDIIYQWGVGTFRVTDVDNTTHLSTWVPEPLNLPIGGVNNEDILLGSAPGPVSEAYRLYINTNQVPHTMAFDSRLYVYGSNVAYIKVFRGTDVSENGTVISAIFNTNNVLVGENIPLELAANIPNTTNLTIKVPALAWSIETLLENEVCTAVLYTSGGIPVAYYRLMVRNTNFIRTANAAKKYITAIELITPFLSNSDNHLVEVPINLPVNGLSFLGKARYSDGDSVTFPVDIPPQPGSKFELMGIENFVASVVGQTVPLVLKYNMSPDEFGYDIGGPTPERFKVEDYSLTTLQVQGIYSIKLFVVPRRVGATDNWMLEYYMTNLDRDEVYRVTPYVEYGTLSPVFNGTNAATGVRQTLTVAFNLQDLGTFNYFRHVQTFSITMTSLPSNTTANGYFILEYTDGNAFAQNLEAVGGVSVIPGRWTLNLTNGFASLTDWRNALYNKIESLYISPSEPGPLTPTHFRVILSSFNSLTGDENEQFSREIDMNDWNALIDDIDFEPLQGRMCRIEFFKREGMNDLELGVASLVIQRPA